MKKIFGFLAIAALTVTSAAAQAHRTARRSATAKAASPSAELTRISNEFVSAYARHDAAVLERIESQDFKITRADGKVLGKTQDVAAARDRGAASDDEVKNDEVKVRVYGLGAVVSGRAAAKRSDVEQSARYINVFEKQRGHWVLVASQWTREGGTTASQPGASAGGEVTTPTGLKYVDLVVGTGASPKPGQQVTVQYVGTLTNGQKFDSSYDRNEPFTFQIGVGRVIKGWDEGVMSMKIGGKRRLIIPPDLGYGARGAGKVIPPNATLIFEVELLAVQ